MNRDTSAPPSFSAVSTPSVPPSFVSFCSFWLQSAQPQSVSGGEAQGGPPGGPPGGPLPRIAVVVRKRPLSALEVMRKDTDLVRVRGGQTIIVDEPR